MAGFEEISRVKHRKVGRRVLLNLVARGDELLKAMAPGVTGQKCQYGGFVLAGIARSCSTLLLYNPS